MNEKDELNKIIDLCILSWEKTLEHNYSLSPASAAGFYLSLANKSCFHAFQYALNNLNKSPQGTNEKIWEEALPILTKIIQVSFDSKIHVQEPFKKQAHYFKSQKACLNN